MMTPVRCDTEIATAIAKELDRQQNQIELIASENIVSADVLAAQGSVLTNKYAEGYPGRRYYGGCEFVDTVEELAIGRAKKLFDASFVNVQPHSGAQANQAVFLALLKPGDRIMGLSLAHGGHLTHGSPVTMSGKWFDVVSFDVRKSDQLIDMDHVRKLALETRPKLIVAGASAYPRAIDFAGFRAIADELVPISWWIWRTTQASSRRPITRSIAPCPRCHHNDPQDIARPSWWHDPDQCRGHREKAELSRIPRKSGGTFDACDCRQGGGLRRSVASGVS